MDGDGNCHAAEGNEYWLRQPRERLEAFEQARGSGVRALLRAAGTRMITGRVAAVGGYRHRGCGLRPDKDDAGGDGHERKRNRKQADRDEAAMQ
jgi:hypothetical protein